MFSLQILICCLFITLYIFDTSLHEEKPKTITRLRQKTNQREQLLLGEHAHALLGEFAVPSFISNMQWVPSTLRTADNTENHLWSLIRSNLVLSFTNFPIIWCINFTHELGTTKYVI
ncbi:hypothetical protein VNO78_17648 [Psophocarpus tetragonolobus]|uniref:Uncharacterized protein n=1 Tax=Psophocarpus tetragonolobus TaxID=3891 RepID=A0AAN9SNM8_PSOTE